ncbi:MAG: UDP-N-acetylmuramate dehydrogenase [Bacteroidota bacterium]
MRDFSLKGHNSFAVDVKATEYVAVTSVADLQKLHQAGIFQRRHLILGGGSNVLFRDDYEGLVVHVQNTGIQELMRDDQHVFVEVAAGENWHGFVQYAIAQGWAGIENLSLIPGTVGAAPIQNIGAYGVELQDVFHTLKAFDKETGKEKEFNLEACGFDYRDSVFKRHLKNRYIITSVTFRLNLAPEIKLDYGNLKSAMQDTHGEPPYSIQQVSEVVSRIRQHKLPDPSTIGSAGSFFKNPIVSKAEYERVKAIADDIVAYPVGEKMKLAAGWLIDQAGLKGIRKGDAGTYQNQALVIVNHGSASGSELYALSEHIQQVVFDKFGVHLEREVNVIG